jgi:hypothetical protein
VHGLGHADRIELDRDEPAATPRAEPHPAPPAGPGNRSSSRQVGTSSFVLAARCATPASLLGHSLPLGIELRRHATGGSSRSEWKTALKEQ